ncbi:hypothetical protein FA09DRAFT_243397 [Tilletiopsis washingtonensis]|uniref:Uncharacterized protein n=1 Tax=Tilletiopsis washingtonensis TaxID=58919 RepID=A0A316ZDL9_9BASI|nr:hypothetical protein FA09DRAFT_243397 [Tilletiopsis washingtonensis]PWN99148.1 hypothetical protein FA09DRAFT_243397 [Tilletiopsis washingtonensis]
MQSVASSSMTCQTFCGSTASRRTSSGLAAQRLILTEAVQFCLLTLHRPLLMHGSQAPDSSASAKASVEAARAVIFCAAELERTVWAARKFPTFRRHSHAAAIVLALHLLNCARQGVEEPLAAALREEIDAALVHASDGAAKLAHALLVEAARRATGKPDTSGAPLGTDVPDGAENVEQHDSEAAPADASRLGTSAVAATEAASIEQALQALDSSRPVELYFAQLLSASVPHAPPEDLWSTLDRALPSA